MIQPTFLPSDEANALPNMQGELIRAYWEGDSLVIEGVISSEEQRLEHQVRAVALVSRVPSSELLGVMRTRTAAGLGRWATDDGRKWGLRFTSVIKGGSCLDAGGKPGKIHCAIHVATDERSRVIPFTLRNPRGAAGVLLANWSEGVMLAPAWADDVGLTITSSRPMVIASGVPRFRDGAVEIPFSTSNGFSPVSVAWAGSKKASGVAIGVTYSAADNAGIIRLGAVPESRDEADRWSIRLSDADGRQRRLHCGPEQELGFHFDLAGTYSLDRGSDGLLRLVCRKPVATMNAVALTEDGSSLLAEMELWNAGVLRVEEVLLEGKRAVPHAEHEAEGKYRINLKCRLWRNFSGVIPSGNYRFSARLSDSSVVQVRMGDALRSSAFRELRSGECVLGFESAPDGQMLVEVSAPLSESEKGSRNRKRLGRKYTGANASPGDGVFLESWYGKSFSDNPAALVRALRLAEIPGPYYATVADGSVEVPEATVPVIAGSREYWKALGGSRFVVFNTWLPSEFTKANGQFIVQTWHGTPLKTLGVHTPDRVGREKSAQRLEAGAKEWDLLVTQNPFASDVLRRAYLYSGRIVESGYPRNDLLAAPEKNERRNAVRDWLGIPHDARVVLYAPTWREEAKGSIGPLDVASLRSKLPEDVVILARGHSVALRRGADINGSGVIDVTSYPEPADLMLASDCLLTDYSSIMFDYPVLGRPIVYYAPDFEKYTMNGRGTYFDLRDSAPGPIAVDEASLVGALDEALQRSWVPDEKYRLWKATYCPHDDGRASERVVRAMIELAS